MKNLEMRQDTTIEDDKAELFYNVFEGYKLHQMCESEEFRICNNLAAQILCEKCRYKSKECDDSGTMAKCMDGTCIEVSYVCDGKVDCPELRIDEYDEDAEDEEDMYKKKKFNEDEYLCPKWMFGAEESTDET